jgi:hypothetical protein
MKRKSPKATKARRAKAGQANNPKKPSIVLSGRSEEEITDQAIVVLASTNENLFQRCDKLVQLSIPQNEPDFIERPKGIARIVTLQKPTLKEQLASRILWLIQKDDEFIKTSPPGRLAETIIARQAWREIPHLEGIVRAPVIRPDGTILEKRDMTKRLVSTSNQTKNLNQLTKNQATLRRFRPLMIFSKCWSTSLFRKKNIRSRVLAAILTPFARYAFKGPSPLFLIDSNVRGSGKSLLADVTSMLWQGAPMPRTPAPNDDEEWRKTITTFVRDAEPIILIDNVVTELGSKALDAALTGSIWKNRLLGKNEQITAPLQISWYVTGNNLLLKADTTRRCLHIKLDSKEERSEFRHPDLLKWVNQNRPRLVKDVLTILRAFFVAGRPKQNIPPWGSFEGWSDLVREAVCWVTGIDPGNTRNELVSQSDTEAHLLGMIIEGIRQVDSQEQGLTTGELLRLATDKPEQYPCLRSAFQHMAVPPADLPSPQSIGRQFQKYRRRVCSVFFLDSINRQKQNRWFVRSVEAKA